MHSLLSSQQTQSKRQGRFPKNTPFRLIVLAIKRPVYYASQTLLFVFSSQFPQGPQPFKAQLRIARGTGNGQETKKGRWDKNVDRFSCLLADQDNEREQTNPC
jgi:hypothetical protein